MYSIVRTLHVSTPLTSLVFSPEGGALYLGTQCGKLLIQNLRELDKPPKSVTVSSEGYRVMTLSIQARVSHHCGRTCVLMHLNLEEDKVRSGVKNCIDHGKV